MKRLTAVFALAAIGVGPIAGAQALLTNLTLSESAMATATSIDYRYTKHTISAGGRGGHTSTYYSWDPHVDQAMSFSLPMILNGSSGNATSFGTFYAPTYGVTTSATTSLTSTARNTVFATTYNATTTLNTPPVAHQNVTVTAQPGGTVSFTLTSYTNVKVVATGSAYGVFRLFAPGVGVVLGPLYGAGTMVTDTSLPPGNYWITNTLVYSASQNTQSNSLLNPGVTGATYGFTVTFSQGSADTGGGD
jgi:plastocyanin